MLFTIKNPSIEISPKNKDMETLTNHFIVGMVVALCSGIAIWSAYNVFENERKNKQNYPK